MGGFYTNMSFWKGLVYLYVRSDSKMKTLQDFIKEAKERQLKVSSWGMAQPPILLYRCLVNQRGSK